MPLPQTLCIGPNPNDAPRKHRRAANAANDTRVWSQVFIQLNNANNLSCKQLPARESSNAAIHIRVSERWMRSHFSFFLSFSCHLSFSKGLLFLPSCHLFCSKDLEMIGTAPRDWDESADIKYFIEVLGSKITGDISWAPCALKESVVFYLRWNWEEIGGSWLVQGWVVLFQLLDQSSS